MDELFTPSAVPIRGAGGSGGETYHDAANSDDCPQIEATRKPQQQQRRRQATGPRRRISVTERKEEERVADDTSTKSASNHAAPLVESANDETAAITDNNSRPREDAVRRSKTGSMGSSISFSYKDIYGSDDDDNVLEVEHGEVNFSNRSSRNRRLTIDSADNSMVSIIMRSPANSSHDDVGGLIANLYTTDDDDDTDTHGQCSIADDEEGRIQQQQQNVDEPQASLLISAVDNIKGSLFGRKNTTESLLQRLGSEIVRKQDERASNNNHHTADDDGSDHSDSASESSRHQPLHLSQQPEENTTTSINRQSGTSDTSKSHRKSGGNNIPFLRRFQKQNSNQHDSINHQEEEEMLPKSKAESTFSKEGVDDSTPSTSESVSCPSPDLPPKNQHEENNEQQAQLNLLQSMATEAQHELSDSIPSATGTRGARKNEEDDTINKSASTRGSLIEIFTAALSNDEDGSRATMNENEKAQIIEQLELLVKMDNERSGVHGDSDDDSSSPRFRPSIVEDFTAAANRESFHRRLTASDSSGGLADSQNTLDWPSPVSSLASPNTENNQKQGENNKNDEVDDDQDIKSKSSTSRQLSIELDLSDRGPPVSTVGKDDPLHESVEWPELDTSYPKLSTQDDAHEKAIHRTASNRSLVQTLRQSSLKQLMNETNTEAGNSTEHAMTTYNDSSEDKQLDKSERSDGAEHIQRPSYSSSHRSSQSTQRSSRSLRKPTIERRTSEKSGMSMSSLESFASATNRLERMETGNLRRVDSNEALSSFGSVTSGLYRNGNNKEGTEDQKEIESTSLIGDKELNESRGNVVAYPSGMRQLSRNSFSNSFSSRAERMSDRLTETEGSLSVNDFDSSSSERPSFVSSSGRPSTSRQSSGLASDVPLLLNSSTTLFSEYSTDGIEYIDPSDPDTDDFDFAMNSYSEAVKYGHFDSIGEASSEDNDHLLATKAYMGLGFARQCRGELASSLDAYTKALELCEAEIGLDDPINAIIQYACGNVLNEMERCLEASIHFRNALRFYKSREQDGIDAQVNVLFIEGMMFSALEEPKRALDCLREGLRIYQSSQRPLNLKLATIMYEMGSILSQNGEYIDSASFFKFALHVRKTTLSDSFFVARTHYSLGVTLASQEVLTNTTTDAFSHLEEALRICQQEFDGDSLQTAVILHAMGVLKERKGDFLGASSWFKQERDMLISLFGEDHQSVGSISSDLGTCYYNVGKYESARQMFEDTLRIVALSYTDSSLEIADTLYKIASCHDSLCEFDEALEKFYRVKQIRQSHLGMENSLVVQTMLRIGNVLLCKGEATPALECFGEILGIGYASDSVNAIEVANALYGRGCAQFCSFQLPDAMKSFSESLNWKLAALGENDPGLACIFYQMAHVHLQQSENEEAVTYFEEYARLLKLDPQRNLHDNAEICFTEGIIAKMKGNLEAALSFYKTALAMFDTLFNGNHEKIASIHFEIGCVLSELGDLEAALHQFQICLLKRRKLLGLHVDVANVLLEMSSLFTKVDDFESVERCLEESDNIWKAKLVGNNEKLTSVLLVSGKRWKSMQYYKEAEANFEQALEMAITMHGQKHELVAEILLDLGELLQEISQIQQVSIKEQIHLHGVTAFLLISLTTLRFRHYSVLTSPSK